VNPELNAWGFCLWIFIKNYIE